MQVDRIEHKEALLELLMQASFPGKMIDFVHELQESIRSADVVAPEGVSEGGDGS